MIQPAFIPADILHFAGNSEAAWGVMDTFRALPERFREPVKSRYSQASMQGGQAAAKSYISKVEKELAGAVLPLAASDSEICDYAKEREREVRSLLMAQCSGTSEELRAVLVGYCQVFGATVPAGALLAGLVGRMTDAAWWRRQVRRNHARQVEAHAIGLGFVHRRAGLYASDEAVKRHAEQQARNKAALEATEATNEAGLTMTLAALSAVSVSNPKIRRGELMTRIAGFEDCAKAAGHVGMFYTATAPSRMHPRLAASGSENPKYDGTTPKACAAYLSKTWSKARAWLHRRGISIYGFRVAEPHHDGTPHWHMLFFMLAEVAESVTHCLKRYFSETDAAELMQWKAQEARFNSKKIDWKRGSAAGYISKYIAKNIDGLGNNGAVVGNDGETETEDGAAPTAVDKTAPRVLAWASTWGIRQFQQIGGPGVTVWRELRRVREAVQGDLFAAWSAADSGNWQQFTESQGGAVCRRDERPVVLWKETDEQKTNKYGEPAGPQVVGVALNRPTLSESNCKTRLHTWEIKKVSKAAPAVTPEALRQAAGQRQVFKASERPAVLPLTLGAWRPWSPVNNCTPSEKDADGNKIGAFFAGVDVPSISLSDDMKQQIKAAQVAAVLGAVKNRRHRGAFG